MLDIQLLRNNLPEVARLLASRGVTLDTEAFRALEDERKALQIRTQELQAKRNSASKLIGQLKAKGESAAAVMEEVAGLGEAFEDSVRRAFAEADLPVDIFKAGGAVGQDL